MLSLAAGAGSSIFRIVSRVNGTTTLARPIEDKLKGISEKDWSSVVSLSVRNMHEAKFSSDRVFTYWSAQLACDCMFVGPWLKLFGSAAAQAFDQITTSLIDGLRWLNEIRSSATPLKTIVERLVQVVQQIIQDINTFVACIRDGAVSVGKQVQGLLNAVMDAVAHVRDAIVTGTGVDLAIDPSTIFKHVGSFLRQMGRTTWNLLCRMFCAISGLFTQTCLMIGNLILHARTQLITDIAVFICQFSFIAAEAVQPFQLVLEEAAKAGGLQVHAMQEAVQVAL